MITIQDLIEFSELSEEEIEAIAEHDHEHLVISLAHGEEMVHCEEGICTLQKYIIDDIEQAKLKGDKKRVRELKHTYKVFIQMHQTRSSSSN